MTRAAKKAILALFVVSLICTTTHAQSRQGDPLRFSLKVGAEYTDNRDSQAYGESNTDIWAKPRLDAIVDWDRGLMDLYYQPAFRYRTKPSDVQNYTELHHDVSVLVKHEINPRLKFDAMERFARTDDPSVQRGGTTLRRDSSYIMNWTELGADFRVRPRTALSIGGGHNFKRYDENNVAAESDEDKTDADLAVTHYVAPTLAVAATAKAEDIDYEHSEGIDRDYTASSFGLLVSKILSKDMRTDVYAGYSSLDYDSDDIASDDSPYVGIDFQVSPMPSRRFLAGAIHEIRDSYAYPHASQEYSSIHGRAELDFGARLILKIGVEYRVGDYDVETVPADAMTHVLANAGSYPDWVQHFLAEGQTSGKEETIITSVEVSFEIDKNTSVALTQRYEDVDSDVGVSFDRNAVGLILTRSF